MEQRQQVQLTGISDAINERVKGWLVKVLEQITQMKQTSQTHSAAMCGFKEQLTALSSFLQAVQKSAAEEKAARDAQDTDVKEQLVELRREMAELKRAQHQPPVGTMPVPPVVDAHPNPSWTSLLDNLTDAVSFGQGSGMNGGLLPHDPAVMWQQQQPPPQQQQQHGAAVEHLSAMMSGYDGAEGPSAVDYEAETGYVAESHADAAGAVAEVAASPAREAASAAEPVAAAAMEHDRASPAAVENTTTAASAAASAAGSESGSVASPRAGSAVAAEPAPQQKQQKEKEKEKEVQDKKPAAAVPTTTTAAAAAAVPPQPKAAPAAVKSAKEAKEPPAAGNTSPSFRNVTAGSAPPPTAAAVVAAAAAAAATPAATTPASTAATQEPKAKAEPALTKKEKKAAAAAAAAAAAKQQQQPQQASSSSPKSAAAGSAAAAAAAAGPAAKSDDAQAREEAIEQAKSKMSPGSMFAVIELSKESHQKYGITRVDGSITNVDDTPPAIAYRAGVRKGMTVLSMAELSGENTRLYCLGIVPEETCLKGTFREKLDSHKMKGNAGVVHLQYTLYAKNHQSGETRDFRTLLVSSEEAAGLTDGQAVDAAAFSHTRSADKMYVNATDVAPDHTPVSNPTVSWVNGPPATVSAAARPQPAAAATTASDAAARVVAAVKTGSPVTPYSGMPAAGKQQFEQREVRCKFTIIKGAGAKNFGLRTSGGVVTEVQRNGPAAKAGVREGMEVMEGGREESGNKMILWTNLHQCSTKVTGLVDPLFNEERQCGEVELRSFLYLHEKPEKKAIVNTPEATEKHGRRSVKPGVRLRRKDRVEFEFNVGFNPRERREMLYVVACEVRRDN